MRPRRCLKPRGSRSLPERSRTPRPRPLRPPIGWVIPSSSRPPARDRAQDRDGRRTGRPRVGATEVREAWRDLNDRLHGLMTGVFVQRQVSGGVEMLVGMVEDPTFGPVLACASGGTLAEVLADSQFRLHPITDLDAQAMVEGLRSSVLLRGYRGAQAADVAALRETLSRLSALVDLAPEIRELDINPLSVLPSGVTSPGCQDRDRTATHPAHNAADRILAGGTTWRHGQGVSSIARPPVPSAPGTAPRGQRGGWSSPATPGRWRHGPRAP